MINTQSQKIVPITPPGAIVDNAAITTTEIDTLGFDYCDIYVFLGALDIAVAALKISQSDVAGSGHADITGGDYTGAFPSATDDNKIYAFHVNLLGKKRYLDLVLTGGDGSTGTYATAFAVLSRAKEHPNTAAERGVAAELFV